MKKEIAICLTAALLAVSFSSCAQSETASSGSDALSESGYHNSSQETVDVSSAVPESSAVDENTSSEDTETTSSRNPVVTSSEKTVSEKNSSTKASSTGGGNKVTSSTTNKAPTVFDYTKYNLDTYITPVWEGNTVYNETIMFVPKDRKNTYDAAPLLYQPTKVLSVRSYDLKTEYEEGVDYTVSNGCIKLTENTRIPKWEYNDYYVLLPDAQATLPSVRVPGRFLTFGAGGKLAQMQVCVTYTHADKWNGPTPAYEGDKLPKTMQLLQNKKPMTVVFNGDSVMAGCDSSGFLKIEPNMPSWADMLVDQLEAVYGNKITSVNTAVGGTTSEWGAANVQSNIIQHNPDLVVLRFGTNDASAGMTAEAFRVNMQKIIDEVRKSKPNCEFLLVSSTVPNEDASGWAKDTHYVLQDELEKIAKNTTGVAVAKVFDMQQYILTKKRYWDMTTNNVNHPSDFFIRVTAQTVSKALIADLK